MIKYLLLLLLISSPVIADNAYFCDTMWIDSSNHKLIKTEQSGSVVVTDDLIIYRNSDGVGQCSRDIKFNELSGDKDGRCSWNSETYILSTGDELIAVGMFNCKEVS